MNEKLAANKFLTIAGVLVAMALVLTFAAPEQTVAAFAESIGLQDQPVAVKVTEPGGEDAAVRPPAGKKQSDGSVPAVSVEKKLEAEKAQPAKLESTARKAPVRKRKPRPPAAAPSEKD